MVVPLLAGMATGCVTGFYYTFMGIPTILSGILTQLGLYSINLKIMGRGKPGDQRRQVRSACFFTFYPQCASLKNTHSFSSHCYCDPFVAILYWFSVELGCSIRATRYNDKMARAQGINTDFNRVLGLMISNGMVALSGAFFLSIPGALPDINMGRGAIVIGLAAVIIGEADLRKDLQKLLVYVF